MSRGIPIAAMALTLLSLSGWAAQRYPVTGLVLAVDSAHHSMTVSCQSVSGYMDAMTMPFSVRDPKALDGLAPGTMIDFMLVVDKNSSYADDIRVHRYENLEQEPLEARRLALLNHLSAPATANVLASGQPVPDFTLTDQTRQPVTFSKLNGKVVAISFAYISCPNPDYCFRLANNLSQLRKRFPNQMGRDLVLLTIIIDPEHDQGEALANYARVWNADPQNWHFLTGPLPEIKRVSSMFGMEFWKDEALLTHSFHTVVIDRQGRLAANLEGNQFTAQQLGDLVKVVLTGP